jgi:hypothetical protein
MAGVEIEEWIIKVSEIFNFKRTIKVKMDAFTE